MDLPAHHPTYLNASPTGRSPYPSASLLHSIDLRWYWNIYQFPIDYAFRAGRNLPDKEFRYLRTVIVTAAVYWGFGSKLSLFPLTFQHRAGVSPYTSPCGFAMTCVFAKQSPGPFLCDSSVLCIARILTLMSNPSPEVTGSFCRVP